MPPASAQAVLQAFVFQGGRYLGMEVFVEQQIVVGSHAGADLVLASAGVSALHAVIEVDGERVRIRDPDGNGLLVNGAAVDHAELTGRDELRIADFSLKLKLVRQVEAGAGPVVSSPGGGAGPAPAPRAHDSEGAPPALIGPDDETAVDFGAGAAAQARAKPARAQAVAVQHDRGRAPHVEAASTHRGRHRGVEAGAAPAHAASGDAAAAGPGRPRARPATHRWLEPLVHAARRLLAPSRSGVEATRALRGGQAAPAPQRPPEQRLEAAARRSTAPALELDEQADEELGERSHPPLFSLPDMLAADDARVRPGRAGMPLWLEVMAACDDVVEDLRLLRPGQSYWSGARTGWLGSRARELPPRIRLAKLLRKGAACRVEVRERAAGHVLRGGQRIELAGLTAGARRNTRRKTYGLRLEAGEVLDLQDGRLRYRVRFVEPPAVAQARVPLKERLKPSRLTLHAAAGSAGVHLVLLLVMALAAPDASSTTAPRQLDDQFVEITLDSQIQLEEPKPVEQPQAPQVEPTRAPAPARRARNTTKRPKSGGASPGAGGVLNLLSKHGSSAAPGPAAVVAAASNVTSAKVPGPSSGFRISGLQSKTATGSLSLGGGGGGITTKGGTQLLRGGEGGAGRMAGSKSGDVGGVVKGVPQKLRAAGGTLDRAEILRVINSNIGQVQRCYERALLRTPGLSGKIQVEWVIAANGSVASARQALDNLGSTEVSSCIMGAIKNWRFPRPSGGNVTVSYPFSFRSTGF